jgi:hypothetical protein
MRKLRQTLPPVHFCGGRELNCQVGTLLVDAGDVHRSSLVGRSFFNLDNYVGHYEHSLAGIFYLHGIRAKSDFLNCYKFGSEEHVARCFERPQL